MEHDSIVERLQGLSDLHVVRARDDTFNANNESPNKRVSDSSVASDPFENATPATLDADLAHYKVSNIVLHSTYYYLHLLSTRRIYSPNSNSPT